MSWGYGPRISTRHAKERDGDIQRAYSVFCGMPNCTNHKTLSPRSNATDGTPTKRDTEQWLREKGWSNRDVLGWCCPDHTGHERRKAKKALS